MIEDFINKTVVIRSSAGWTYIGKLDSVSPTELCLSKAAWVADSGRWGAFVAGAQPAEAEPWPAEALVMVSRIGSEVSLTPHTLPIPAR